MKKLLLWFLLLIPFCVKAQNPVVVSAPQIFQKYVHVKGSLFSDSTLLSTDSTNRVPTTAWAKRLVLGAHGSTGINGLGGTTNIGLGGTLITSTSIIAPANISMTFSGSSGTWSWNTTGEAFSSTGGSSQYTISTANSAGGNNFILWTQTNTTGGNIQIAVQNASGKQYSLNMSGLVFGDAVTNKGAVYAFNYGANFTARSLIDKGYVDSTVTAHAGIRAADTAAMLANYIPKFINSTVPSIKTFSKPLNLATQSTSPGAPGSGIYLYADSINRLSWEKSDGHRRTLKMPYAGNQVAAFELKAAYTLADSADVAGKAPLASPFFTGTPILPGMTLTGDILPSFTNTYSLGASGNVMLGIWTNNANITNLVASNATFGTPGGSAIFIKGTTSGTIQLIPQAIAATGGGTYGWYWPVSAGSAGQVLTSDGGVGTGQTWTSLTNYAFGSPTATTQSALDNSTKVSTTAYTDAAVAATATYFAASFLAGAGTSGSPYDFNYARSGTYTADQIISLSSLAATQTNGFELVTPTASTSGATVENSPALHFGAHVWKSGGTAGDRWSDFMILNEPTTGTTPTGNLNIYASVSTTGTPSYSLVGSFGSNGNWSIQGNLFANIFSSIGQINHLVGGSGSLTQVAGTGAGTSPTITLTGNDLALKVAVTTGTSPTGSNAIVSTITFNSTFASAPRVILVAANAAAAGLSGANEAFVNDASTTTAHFVIESGSTALAASTAYIWYAYIIQ